MSLTRCTTNQAFTSHVATGMTFPDGRQVTQAHDALYRRTSLDEASPAGPIASWEFFGPGRVAEVTLGNGLACTFMDNARSHSAVQSPGAPLPAWGSASSDRLGYDGSGRMIAKRFIPAELDSSGGYADTTPVVGFTTAFDKSSNKFFERHLHAESRSHLYQPSDVGAPEGSGIDSVNRLLQYQRGTLSASGGGGGSVTTPIALPGTDSFRGYNLDHLGNWKKSRFEPVSGVDTADLRQHNSLNQITSRKVGADPVVPFSYDRNGNLLNDGVRLYKYDALNRLVEVKRAGDEAVIGAYVYDASPARRVRKTVSNGGLSGEVPDGVTDFLYFPGTWQVAEERDGSDDPTKQYLWGIYIDELVQLKTLAVTGPQDLPAGEYYPLQDLLYRTTALTDDAGGIVEAYDTDAYGDTILFDQPGTGDNWWADNAGQAAYSACEAIFCGYRLDPENRLYHVRCRIYAPILGRWIHRDPFRPTIIDNFNYYSAFGSKPTIYTDFFGAAIYRPDWWRDFYRNSGAKNLGKKPENCKPKDCKCLFESLDRNVLAFGVRTIDRLFYDIPDPEHDAIIADAQRRIAEAKRRIDEECKPPCPATQPAPKPAPNPVIVIVPATQPSPTTVPVPPPNYGLYIDPETGRAVLMFGGAVIATGIAAYLLMAGGTVVVLAP